jgi:hypothetical protein
LSRAQPTHHLTGSTAQRPTIGAVTAYRFPHRRLAVPTELSCGYGDGLVLRGLSALPVIPARVDLLQHHRDLSPQHLRARIPTRSTHARTPACIDRISSWSPSIEPPSRSKVRHTTRERFRKDQCMVSGTGFAR